MVGLAAGQFAVCVADSGQGLVDPCDWSETTWKLPVVANSVSKNFVIPVKKVSSITVRINNLNHAMDTRPTDSAPPHIVVGAFDILGRFHPATDVRKDGTGNSYQIQIPADSLIRLAVYSAQIQLSDNGNQPLPAQGDTSTFTQASTASQSKTFVFNATGRH